MRRIFSLLVLLTVSVGLGACGSTGSSNINTTAASANRHAEWAKQSPNAHHVYDQRSMRLIVNSGPFGTFPYYTIERRAGSSSYGYGREACRVVKRSIFNEYGRYYYYERQCRQIRQGHIEVRGTGLLGRLMVNAVRAISPCKGKQSQRSYKRTTRLKRPIDGLAYEVHHYKIRSDC